MRVLVTGASGFIGRNVLLRAPRDWQIVAVYHNTPALDEFIGRHRLTGARAVRCDLTSAAEVDDLAHRENSFDACVYLAANGDPAKSVDHPAWDLQLNTQALVTCLERIRVRRFVYVSSGAVYDGLSGDVTPESPVAPRLPYAIAKLASEFYVRAFCERRQTVESFVNVRFFGAYGPYEAARKITTRWMLGAMNGQREFAIRGDGENLIDFMYVDDAVDGFLKLASSANVQGTADFASGAPVSVNTIVQTMARVLGIDVRITYEGHTDEYIRFRTVDQTMRAQLGAGPRISFEDGVRRLHQFLVQERDGAGRSA
jgi:UDP-glucose 4-epimerase